MKTFLSLFVALLSTVGSIVLLISSQACERKIQNTHHAHTAEEAALPVAVQRFLRAKALHNADSLAAVFAPEALIGDEINLLQGPEARQPWITHHIAIGGTVQVLESIPSESTHTLWLAWHVPGAGGWEAYYTFWHRHERITWLQIGSTPPDSGTEAAYPVVAYRLP